MSVSREGVWVIHFLVSFFVVKVNRELVDGPNTDPSLKVEVLRFSQFGWLVGGSGDMGHGR